jgi:uncharacterized protein YdaU (DUF1376 family)
MKKTLDNQFVFMIPWSCFTLGEFDDCGRGRKSVPLKIKEQFTGTVRQDRNACVHTRPVGCSIFLSILMGLPYFPFYPDRWLSSSRIDLMSAEEERGYLRLLLRSWGMPDCTLPDDKNKLLKWSLLTDAEAYAKLMQSMFERTEKGWRNPVLYEEWLKAKCKHERMSKNASARWKREKGNAEAYAKHMQHLQCKGNDNQNQNQNYKEPIAKKPKKTPADPRISTLKEYFITTCLERKNL